MISFPDGKRFAFTILDETDYSTLEKIGPAYRLLADLGFRTTKTVWPLASDPRGEIGGSTLVEAPYLEFIRSILSQGFEIALHGVRNHDASRATVEQGLGEFRRLLGQDPRTHCNHLRNRDNLYWDRDRFTTRLPRLASRILEGVIPAPRFEGDEEGSPYFWGDLCRDRIDYVRNFVLKDINLLRVNPTLPYHNPRQPFVRFWFSSTFGDKAPSFCRALREKNQDRLEEEGGVCILYTHFGLGFCENGELHTEFARLMRRLARKNGWFVPVATLLDFLRSRRQDSTIPLEELRRLERRWLFQRLARRAN